jgi:hypothetical protein
MPFTKIYDVNFSNGNLHPHLNLKNWPNMKLTSTSNPAPEGLVLEVIRGPVTDENINGDHPALNTIDTVETPGIISNARSDIFIQFPKRGLPIDSRLSMSVTFDLPQAEGFLPDGGLVPINLPGISPAGPVSIPEPWGIGLSISPTSDLSSNYKVITTCQFHRVLNGIRLNTPTEQGVGTLQSDKATPLETPLNYSSYRGGYTVLPNGREVQSEPPLFTLTFSFCGWGTIANKHSVGCGFLKIAHSWKPEAEDHRVFSSNALIQVLDPVTFFRTEIRSLGISVGTVNGVGKISARMRSFSLSINESIV